MTGHNLGGGQHPGAALRHELAQRGCTQAQFADLIGRPVQLISEIFNARKAITPDTAIQLEQALGIPAERWLYAQADHDLQRTRQRHDAAWPYLTCINDADWPVQPIETKTRTSMKELVGRGFTMQPKHDGTQTTYVVYDPVDSFRTHRARALKDHLRKDAYTIALWTDNQGPTWLDVGCDSLNTAIALLEVHWQGWIHIDAIRAELGTDGILDARGLRRHREAWLSTRN